MSKIYQITILEDSESIGLDNDDFTHPFFPEVCLYLNDDDINNIEFSDDDKIFTQLDSLKFKRFIKTLEKYFKIDILDISDKVITNEIVTNCSKTNLFLNFRKQNETIDDVLDKISKFGINSLDSIDENILKKSH